MQVPHADNSTPAGPVKIREMHAIQTQIKFIFQTIIMMSCNSILCWYHNCTVATTYLILSAIKCLNCHFPWPVFYHWYKLLGLERSSDQGSSQGLGSSGSILSQSWTFLGDLGQITWGQIKRRALSAYCLYFRHLESIAQSYLGFSYQFPIRTFRYLRSSKNPHAEQGDSLQDTWFLSLLQPEVIQTPSFYRRLSKPPGYMLSLVRTPCIHSCWSWLELLCFVLNQMVVMCIRQASKLGSSVPNEPRAGARCTDAQTRAFLGMYRRSAGTWATCWSKGKEPCGRGRC